MKNLKIILHLIILLLFSGFNLFAQENLVDEKMFSEIQLAELRFQQELSLLQNRLRNDANGPFLFVHGKKTKISFLLIHGFTASPWEMKNLGEYLYERGYNIYGMLLEGHGTKEEDLLKVKREDWFQSVNDAYELTKLIGDNVIVVGFSMGGNLALHLAVNKPEVEGVVSLASALIFEDWKIVLSPAGKYFIKYSKRPLTDGLKPYYYENRAVTAISELYKLSKVTKKELNKVTQPVLIIHSKNDKTIKPESSEYIYEKIGSKNKKIIFFDSPSHILTTSENPRQEEVFEIIYNWVKALNIN